MPTPANLFASQTANSQSLSRGGTPPLSRNSSGTYPKRSSVVPFTRPGQRGSGEDGSSSFSETGSHSQPGSAGFRPRRSTPGQGVSHSFEEYYSASPSRRRSDTDDLGRPDRNSFSVKREEGFQLPSQLPDAQHPSQPRVQWEGSPQGHGLLSRHFSGSLTPAPSDDALKERLQKCLDQPPAQRLPAVESDGAAVRLLKKLQAQFEVFQLPSVQHAFRTASSVLRNHHRIGDGLPPMVRNLEAAGTLAELGAGSACVSAALFHSVLERKAMSDGQLRELLPNEVASLVTSSARVADLCKVRQQSAAQMDAATLRKFSHMLLAMADVQAVLVVLADRLQTLRSGLYTPAEAQEVLDVYAPLADQLGVWSLKADLEDLAFQALHPKEHAELRSRLQASMQTRTIERSLDALKAAVGSRGMTDVDLVGRPKNLYSVWRKMKAKGYGLEQLYDLRALRIVVRSKADCYWALREVEQLWQVVPGRDKDYIRQPKANGYQSLHTVVIADDGVPMEVQIRTDKMHFISEYGVAAHWRYKEDAAVRDIAREQQVAWARWLIAWQLELVDKKLRPTGSPAHDSSLSHICPFPAHNPLCPALDTSKFLQRHAPRPLQQSGSAEAPVYAIVLDHASRGANRQRVSIKELPPNSTAGQLHGLLQLQSAASNSSCSTHLLVNGVSAAEDQLLAHGDKVEVLPVHPPLHPPLLQPLPSLSHLVPTGLPTGGSCSPGGMAQYSPVRLQRQTAALRN